MNEKMQTFTLQFLLNLKNNHSKMKDTHYERIETQQYFLDPNIDTQIKRHIYSFRVRMADFGENFRGNRAQVLCPLGCASKDTQQHAYEQCEPIHSKVNIEGKYVDLFEKHIPPRVAANISKIILTRKTLLDERFIQFCPFGGNETNNLPTY